VCYDPLDLSDNVLARSPPSGIQSRRNGWKDLPQAGLRMTHKHMYTFRPHHFLVAVLLATSIYSAPALASDPYAIESAQPKASELPPGMADQLDPHGSVVSTESNGLGMPICEVFWAKAVLLQDGATKSGRLNYRSLRRGSLLGVIHFLPEASDDFREDFHDQKLKAGYYTMRYETIKDDDSRDFVLLSPIRLDGDPRRVLSMDELTQLSRVASRTSRPAVMSLVGIQLGETVSPSLRADDQGTCILQVNLHVQSPTGLMEFPLAIIVVNPIRNTEGS